MQSFAEWLGKEIRIRGWTLETVAKRIGSHKGYISGMRHQKVNPPSAKIVRKLCRIFGQTEEQTKLVLKLAWAEKAPIAIRAEMVDLVLHHNGHCARDLRDMRVVAKTPAAPVEAAATV
jgi:transcriptional regulator with XRE-family HTH domain